MSEKAYMTEYRRWLASDALTAAQRAELEAIAGDAKEIESRFYASLQFGTAGLRGVLGMGTNRMNLYTVGQATQGLAQLIVSRGQAAMDAGVAISYDCRHMSPEFAEDSACVLAANGIHVYLFDAMRPTPELSFAVRRLHCTAGINITASHNPKEYNGYKAYWGDGAQLPPAEADVVTEAIRTVNLFTGVRRMALADAIAAGRVEYLGRDMDEAFLSYSLSLAIDQDTVKKAGLRVIFTPFHGTGYKLVPEILTRLGVQEVIPEPRQSIPDGDFPTVKSPNPQDVEGFATAIAMAREKDIDLILGTDPDADRIGVVARNRAGEYVPFTGNQMGVLLLDYLCRSLEAQGRLPKNGAVVKTIVTTDMAEAVAALHGVATANVFTGFKFLAEKIHEFETTGSHTYLLAFEESYGYLIGDGARDKDAVTTAMLIAEMAAWHALQGRTLCDVMESLYEHVGYYTDHTVNLTLPGVDGLARIAGRMASLRKAPPAEIAGHRVLMVRDYQPGIETELATGKQTAMELRDSNVLSFVLDDGTTLLVRPSGTEPKLKTYIMLHGKDRAECEARMQQYIAFGKHLAD